MVRPLRAGTFSASPQGVERPVNRCTQVVHRNAWTPLHNRGKIVDMIAPVGVLIAAATLAAPAAPTLDPQHLPALPARGFAVSSGATSAFVDLQGHVLGRAEGFRFASENTFGVGMPRFADSHGRLWRLDRPGRRFVPAAVGQHLHGGATVSFVARSRIWLVRRHGRVLMRSAPRERPFVSERRDVVTAGVRALDLRTGTFFKVPALCAVGSGHRPRWILLCGSARSRSKAPQAIVELVGGRLIARAPVKAPAPNIAPVGHWAGVSLSPDGRTLLAQWSAECETPQVFLVTRRTGSIRRLGGAADESIALGWTSDGRALVYFSTGVCGGTHHGGPGIYAVDGRRLRLLFETTGRAAVAMWGG
jgi:hypothetical protein